MPHLTPPDRAARLLLPPFATLPLEAVRVPHSAEDHAQALALLRAERFVGFDTESKPTFNKGETSGGPEVLQFATASFAFVLQLRRPESEALVRALLVDPAVVKVGFGIDQDRAQLQRRLGLLAAPLLDLDRLFHRQGYPRTIGVQAAVALVFGQRFAKSKRVTTSNWAVAQLSPAQLQYAANDAHAALRVLQGLAPAEPELQRFIDHGPGQGRASRGTAAPV